MNLENIDQKDTDFRVWSAYLRENNIYALNLSSEEEKEHKSIAMKNRHLFSVPISESLYLYHGTAKARLTEIRIKGLLPSEKTRWAKDGYAGHALGRVFFTNTVRKADFYAREASKTRPVLLRVLRTEIVDIKPDVREISDTSFFIERSVAPTLIEFWNGKKWKHLSLDKVVQNKAKIKL